MAGSSLLLLGAGKANPGSGGGGGAVDRQAMIGSFVPVFVNATQSRQSVAAGPAAVNER